MYIHTDATVTGSDIYICIYIYVYIYIYVNGVKRKGHSAHVGVYKALLSVYRALLSVYRALLSVNRALLSVYDSFTCVTGLGDVCDLTGYIRLF